jgi:hypothetical protein
LVVPLAGLPVVSFISGQLFTTVIGRCCGPFWIFLELVALLFLSQPVQRDYPPIRVARITLAAAVGIQLALFLWAPKTAIDDYLFMTYQRPPYQASATGLWVPDLSRFGTREIDADVKGLIRSPTDVVVPAIYSNRSFGMDVWLEFGGRLLPLTTFTDPLFRTHGKEGAAFSGTAPFVSSKPLRVIVVASDIFKRPDFLESVDRIKGRFPQARQWIRGPLDSDGRVAIWVADLQ